MGGALSCGGRLSYAESVQQPEPKRDREAGKLPATHSGSAEIPAPDKSNEGVDELPIAREPSDGDDYTKHEGSTQWDKRRAKVKATAHAMLALGTGMELQGVLGSRKNMLIQGALSFIPAIIQKQMHAGKIRNELVLNEHSTEGVMVHQGNGAVAFVDASGFTALTERLAVKQEGAELLSTCLNAFMDPLIRIVFSYGGDIIKFSGDAITILWPYEGDDGRMAVLRAAACCMNLHKELHNFDTKVPLGEGEEGNVTLTLHIGVGAGMVSMLQVGGIQKSYEYVIAGEPLAQISIAEPLAKSGETVLSNDAFLQIEEDVVEGRNVGRDDYRHVKSLNAERWTYDMVKATATVTEKQSPINPASLTGEQIVLMRRFITPFVYSKLEDPAGTSQANEMRVISIFFLQVSGVDVSTTEGSIVAQKLMYRLQLSCRINEGTVNKFLVDDKGLLFLCGFGLPPLIHVDDAGRCIHFAWQVIDILKDLGLSGRIGITTGNVWCGMMGSKSRQEYTFLGDKVNLSARLMANTDVNTLLVDETTMQAAAKKAGIEFTKLQPINVKGKKDKINIFRPVMPISQWGTMNNSFALAQSNDIELYASQISLPWSVRTRLYGGMSPMYSLDIPAFSALRKIIQDGIQDVMKGALLLVAGYPGGGKVDMVEYSVGVLTAPKRNLTSLFLFVHGIGHSSKFLSNLTLMQNLIRLMFGVEEYTTEVASFFEEILPKAELGSLPYIGLGPKGTIDPHMQQSASEELQEHAASACARTLEHCCDHFTEKGLVVVMRFCTGSSLTPDLWSANFWRLVVAIGRIVKQRRERIIKGEAIKPLLAVVASREIPLDYSLILHKQCFELDPLTDWVKENGWNLEIEKLSSEATEQYVHNYLQVKAGTFPRLLLSFVRSLAEGNALFTLETINELLREELIQISTDKCGNKEIVSKDHADPESQVNVAKWESTSMVTSALMSVESLTSDQQKCVKLASVFTGHTVTMSDLSASMKASRSESAFDERRVVDDLHLLLTCKTLVKLGVFEAVGDAEFTIRSPLLKTVARSLVLKGQSLKVKQKTLLNRARNMVRSKKYSDGVPDTPLSSASEGGSWSP